MSTIDMDKLKKCEVEILKEFLFACKVLNLQYYVIGGTLLGTVRHKGFIPWDDDIDVGMPRQDYNVFVREGQKHMNSRFFVQTHESDPEYLNGFAKVRDSGTTFIETSAKNAKINHGIYIDVFPLDDYDMSKNRGFQLRKRFIEERIRMESIPISQVPLRGKMVRPFVKLRYPTADTVCRARDTLFQSMPQGDYMANHCGAWREKEIIPASWYGEGTPLEFEGLQVQVPKEYARWLTQVYGDYMQLPPVEKRVGHHDTEMVDLENPYKKYVNW